MYIKQIIIQGFKSYKEQTVIEPFSPKHNVIVGRNGSGKSNFFAAIRFVLSDAYTQMGREERGALLHEGSGSAVLSAYVEVIFDNSDRRFPTGKDELILRRTIGHQKDEYSLDRKNATKADVMSLLESAGFSRSNPYYIVPQGRVTALTNMKDTERLNLLKEVAGTQVYEARRAESLKIMHETHSKQEKIDELLAYIKERLDELEEEKEELRKFQEKDRERRCLEYTIYQREQKEIAEALSSLDDQRQTGLNNSDDSRNQFLQGEKDISQLENSIAELRQKLEILKVEKDQLDEERRENSKGQAKIELQVQNLQAGQEQSLLARSQLENASRDLQSLIKSQEAELSSLLPHFNSEKAREITLKGDIENLEGIRQRLYTKQGRNASFKSKAERDAWLKKELQSVKEALNARKKIEADLKNDIVSLEKEITELESTVVSLRDQFENRGDTLQRMAAELDNAKTEVTRLSDDRKNLWREEARMISVVENARTELEKSDRQLAHMMDQNTSRGIANVRRIKEQYNIPGIYGTLAELFKVEEIYKTPVEITAGNSLFHYVVDTDQTAQKVVEILQREKGGRVTFMPLNRLRPRLANFPRAEDAIVLLEKLDFDPKYRLAFEQVFGKTVVCPDLSVAANYARSHGVTGITLEGDRSDKKGALTGGYHDPRSSRLDGVQNLQKWRDQHEECRARLAAIRKEITVRDQEVTKAVGETQKIEQRRRQVETNFIPLRNEQRNKASRLTELKDSYEAKTRSKQAVEASFESLQEQINSYDAEIKSEFKKQLSSEEERMLESVGARLQESKRAYSELLRSMNDVETRKLVLEASLRENLYPRLDELRSQEAELSTDSSSTLKDSQKELKSITNALQDTQRRLKSASQAIESCVSELNVLEQQKTDKQRAQETAAATIEQLRKVTEKSIRKRAILEEKAVECNKNIRDLGALPEEAFSKYAKTTSANVVKKLQKVNEELKKFSHLNKKAFEQYNSFTKQRDVLRDRREELDSSQASIDELIQHLDQRKDEAIERTFKQVSKEFATVFEKLVPAGKGRLVIQRKTDRAADADDESDEEAKNSVENYIGVGISVSFNSKHDEQQRIQQLSGGQKSLCALALVFAIQQCDPAPFYLFDEIDANLDAQYRTAVAAMLKNISETSENGQFICTTFRPEMLHVADKCYGVTYQNKTSSINVATREEALEFVEGQTTVK